VTIRSPTYYGGRHGLETLSQMISLDEITESLQMYAAAAVADRPSFPHRGLLIDTARNYINVPTLKSIISAMSFDKLNVFHWHLTDTHSFPLVSRRLPQLSQVAATNKLSR
jgi:hexosaminidase